ncbi:MAG: hypothetical protein M0Z49_03995 [Chloroflexi bacterium]|nr:hypothetical protein [Chloroflexota bacterium]
MPSEPTSRYAATVTIRPAPAFDYVPLDCARCGFPGAEGNQVFRVLVGSRRVYLELHLCGTCARELRTLAAPQLADGA